MGRGFYASFCLVFFCCVIISYGEKAYYYEAIFALLLGCTISGMIRGTMFRNSRF